VNISDRSLEIGGLSYNPFPPDVESREFNGLASVLAHETNHTVNSYTITRAFFDGPGPVARPDADSGPLAARQDQLVDDAGDASMNYLRSMFPDGTFANAHGEFFASIANQWFCDGSTGLTKTATSPETRWLCAATRRDASIS
jgi:hypothetical protein